VVPLRAPQPGKHESGCGDHDLVLLDLKHGFERIRLGAQIGQARLCVGVEALRWLLGEHGIEPCLRLS
jgi:hypothetical protein